MRERTTDIKDIYNEQITPNYDVHQGSSEPQRRFRRSLAHVIIWGYLLTTLPTFITLKFYGVFWSQIDTQLFSQSSEKHKKFYTNM